MNHSKWAQDLAAPLRPLNELLARYAQLRRRHDPIVERHRELGIPSLEEVA